MAISTKRTNQIIADWKAGRFTSFYAVAKHYKISEPTAKKILANIEQSNADIVEIGVAYESAKKISKNLVEVKAIERLVAERTIKEEIRDESLEATLLNVRSLKRKLIGEEIDSVVDHKYAQETLDKAMITSDNAPRHAPKQDINVNATAGAVAQIDNRELSHEELEIELKQRGIPLDLIGR